MQLPVVCEHAEIADEQVIMICIAMGYPGPDFAANAVRTERRSVGRVAVFRGFEQSERC